MSLSPNRDQEILSFEEAQKELDQPMHCMGCGWEGKRLDVMQVSENIPVCPSCEKVDLLAKGRMLDPGDAQCNSCKLIFEIEDMVTQPDLAGEGGIFQGCPNCGSEDLNVRVEQYEGRFLY